MKHSGVLKVLADTTFPVEKLVIHPNTGFDLGFMQVKYVVKLCINTDIEDFKNQKSGIFGDADLHLLNECGAETLEMSQKLWSKLGEPDRCLLFHDPDTNRLFIAAK